MKVIVSWLEQFNESWIKHDIDSVLNLFVEHVEYWETPFQKVSDKAELRREWEAVMSQSNITTTTRVYSSDQNKHSVLWTLRYEKDGEARESAGVYLITLNEDGLCTYFYYAGEQRTRELL